MNFLLTSSTSSCPECGDKLIGRRDKKFCSDQCRTANHNKYNGDQNNFMRNINNILRKNRRILQSKIVGRSSKTKKVDLIDEGFKFSYFTNEYVTKTGKVYRFCYEYGYVTLDNNYLSLVQRKEYVD
ncbi:MAG: hypothetical protein WAT79_04150 [Saprospiraceae bacterium]